MSKPLEESYKAELLQDIPDLWNRIEAGIEATATTQISDEITNNKEVSKKTSTTKNWRIFIAVASPALAACLLLVVIVPVAFSQFGAKDSAPMAVNGMEMAAPMEEDIAYESETTVRGEASDAMMVQGDMAEEEVQEDAQEDAAMPDFSNSLARTFVAEVVSVDGNMVRLRLEPAECQDLMNEFGIVLTEENLYECEISPDNEINPRQGMHYTIRFNRTDGEFMEVIFVKENV